VQLRQAPPAGLRGCRQVVLRHVPHVHMHVHMHAVMTTDLCIYLRGAASAAASGATSGTARLQAGIAVLRHMHGVMMTE
jgi:hypothetical protein